MRIQLIRHATLLLWIGNKKILVDPIFRDKGTYRPVEGVPNQNANPLVELPVSIDDLTHCDAVFITHLHEDHFDHVAAKYLPKDILIFCQPDDVAKLTELGFTQLRPVKDSLVWENMLISRTGGKHGHGLIAAKMAPVSGFVIQSPEEPSLYILGDTVWCSCVQSALDTYQPDICISNCGQAQFSSGKPITMDADDVYKLKEYLPKTKLICVHMEAWNHCRLSRKNLSSFVLAKQLKDVFIPNNGDILTL